MRSRRTARAALQTAERLALHRGGWTDSFEKLRALVISASSWESAWWSDGRLDDLCNTYLVAYEAAWRFFPDADPCLEALGRVAQIAVLSNGNQEQQEKKVSRTGLGRYLDVVQTSDHLGVTKPRSKNFELACVRLGVPARAAVYIGG